MLILADTHVHLYSCYDLPAGLINAGRCLDHLQGFIDHSTVTRLMNNQGSMKILFLTERHDCHFFHQFQAHPEPWKNLGITIEETGDKEALRCILPDEQTLILLAGRQVVSEERLEVLALMTSKAGEDGRPAKEIIGHITGQGGIPVLPWGLGKWSFKRGNLARELFNHYGSEQVLAGDTLLRPAGRREPGNLQSARGKNIKILAGSDPLPFRGEEYSIGRYGIAIEGEFDPDHPAQSMKKLLRDPETVIHIAGNRCTRFSTMIRMIKLQLSNHQEPPRAD